MYTTSIYYGVTRDIYIYIMISRVHEQSFSQFLTPRVVSVGKFAYDVVKFALNVKPNLAKQRAAAERARPRIEALPYLGDDPVKRRAEMARRRNPKRKAMPSAAAVYAKKRRTVAKVSYPPSMADMDMHYVQDDFGNTFTSAGETYVNSDFLLIPQDSSQTGRTGRKVWIKSLDFKLQFTSVEHTSVNSSESHCSYRVMLIRDKQSNGETVTPSTEVLKSASTIAYTNRDNIERFQILYDKRFYMQIPLLVNFNANTYIRPPVETGLDIKRTFPGKGLRIDYDAGVTTGVLSSRSKNNIMLYVVSSHSQPQLTLLGSVTCLFDG